MKNIERVILKYLVVLIVSAALCNMILYPLFDLVYHKLITNSEFVYSFHRYIIQPIIFGCIFGTTFWVVDTKRK